MDHDSYYFDSQYQNYYDSENENGNFCEVGSQNETDGDALLISLVRDHPYLCNKELTDFKDNLKKQNAWTEIGSILNMTVDECQSRWTRLRERYTREKKQRQEETSSGSRLSKRKAFEFFKNMSFLEPFVKRRRTMTNVFSNSSSSLPKQYTLQKNFSSNNEKENNFSLANAITFIEQNSSKNIKSPEQNRYKTSSNNEVNVSSTKAATAIGQSFTDVKNSAHLKDSSAHFYSKVSNDDASSMSALSACDYVRKKDFNSKSKGKSQPDVLQNAICKITSLLENKYSSNVSTASLSLKPEIEEDVAFCQLILSSLVKMQQCENVEKKKKILRIIYDV